MVPYRFSYTSKIRRTSLDIFGSSPPPLVQIHHHVIFICFYCSKRKDLRRKKVASDKEVQDFVCNWLRTCPTNLYEAGIKNQPAGVSNRQNCVGKYSCIYFHSNPIQLSSRLYSVSYTHLLCSMIDKVSYVHISC